MADASLLKLELYRLIEKQTVKDIFLKKLIAVHIGLLVLFVSMGALKIVVWPVSAFFAVVCAGLVVLGRSEAIKNRADLEGNQADLKAVYSATSGTIVSSKDITPG